MLNKEGQVGIANAMLAEGRVDLLKNRKERRKNLSGMFGFKNPPKSEKLKLKYAEGVNYYLLWVGCSDMENIIEAWFPTKSTVFKIY